MTGGGDPGEAVGLKSVGRTQDLATLPSSFFTAAHKVRQAKARLAAKVIPCFAPLIVHYACARASFRAVGVIARCSVLRAQ